MRACPRCFGLSVRLVSQSVDQDERSCQEAAGVLLVGGEADLVGVVRFGDVGVRTVTLPNLHGLLAHLVGDGSIIGDRPDREREPVSTLREKYHEIADADRLVFVDTRSPLRSDRGAFVVLASGKTSPLGTVSVGAVVSALGGRLGGGYGLSFRLGFGGRRR